MRLSDLFVLVRSCNDYSIPYDFYVSRYPVATAGNGQARIGTEGDSLLYRASWKAATRFCDQLSTINYLKPAYGEDPAHDRDAEAFSIVDALTQRSFRLPTPEEWNYAAHGWSGRKTGDYFEVQKRFFKIPFMDYPVTEEQKGQFQHGYARFDELIENHIGLHGMNVYAREWCGPVPAPTGGKGLGIKWQEYYANYNNDIGYQTTTFDVPEGEVLPFRVVLPSPR